jgi:hypothetical protein
MATTVSFGWFISFLFLVVIEIGGVARTLDLERISEQKLPPFFIGLFYLLDTGSQQQQVTIPQLGRFNFLHGANLAIIFLGYVLVTETTTGSTGILFSLITYVVWAIIPLLEVDEYEDILIDGFRPVSYYHHVLVVSATAIYIYFYEYIWEVIEIDVGFPLLKDAVLIVSCIFLYYIMLFGFLSELERELDRIDNEKLPDKITRTDPE